jgi:hypothetical protein
MPRLPSRKLSALGQQVAHQAGLGGACHESAPLQHCRLDQQGSFGFFRPLQRRPGQVAAACTARS